MTTRRAPTAKPPTIAVREHLDAARLLLNVPTMDDWRREMIQIAALAVAAVESYDRKRRP